jgi:hypothetical protein
MNDELQNSKNKTGSLDERFAKRPHTYKRLQEIADLMDQAIAQGATADEAEVMAIEQIQKLGGELLRDWAEAKHQQCLEQMQSSHPQSIKHVKKK